MNMSNASNQPIPIQQVPPTTQKIYINKYLEEFYQKYFLPCHSFYEQYYKGYLILADVT
jgi:hypothetical protein